MQFAELQQNYPSIEVLVNLTFEKRDEISAHELLTYLNTDILTEQNLAQESEIIGQYQVLASKLRAVAFRRFASREIPGIFKNDIAYVLDDYQTLIKNIGFFLDRYKVAEDFARQQRTLIQSLLANKQRLTSGSIVTEDERKVAPTVGNWIKYFYQIVGGQHRSSRIKIAEFFSKDRNITMLTEDDLQKVKSLIRLQEYLRRPTQELMDELVELLVDLGNGVMGYFENGQMYLLSDIDAPLVEQRKVEEKERMQPVNLNKKQPADEFGGLVQQTEQKQLEKEVQELKPVFRATENTLVLQSHEDYLDKSDTVDQSIVIDEADQNFSDEIEETPDVVTHEAPVVKEFVSPFDDDMVQLKAEAMGAAVEASPDELNTLLESGIQGVEGTHIMALLHIIAMKNDWNSAHEFAMNNQSYKAFVEQQTFTSDYQATILLIRFLLEELLSYSTDDTQAIAGELSHIMLEAGFEQEAMFVFFDIEQQKYEWNIA